MYIAPQSMKTWLWAGLPYVSSNA